MQPMSSARAGESWFTRLTGISERDHATVRSQLTLRDGELTSHANGRRFHCGRLEMPSLGELRERLAGAAGDAGTLAVSELVGEAKALHESRRFAGAVFQVASQFNLLEMVGPELTPEHGIGIYERDPTQGPACAIACGAGTIFRNYLVPLDGGIGQSSARQIDCLADLGHALGNADGSLWTMRNGYALPRPGGLAAVARRLSQASAAERDALRALLRIGVQWDTEVTSGGNGQRVTQVYCSALPVAYAGGARDPAWAPFATLVLEAAYEATLAVAELNRRRGASRSVLLTRVGGGAFGNRPEWIDAAIARALAAAARWPLEVLQVRRA